MKHFPFVQSLCRTAMADASPAVRKQVERLRNALANDGEGRQAASLSRLLHTAERTREVAPSRLVRSRAQASGETLAPNTPLPVDRETSAPLVKLLFPAELRNDPPVFNAAITTAIRTIIEEWENHDGLIAVGLQPPTSCLIHGAPGSGKTYLALWIAHQLDLPVALARLDGLVSSFLGTTARNIGNLFSFANRYRCMLLLDEFDAIAKLRDDPQEVGEIKRVVNALLQNLDGRGNHGFTVGITNHEHLLDPAVWRRFEVQLEIPKPDFRMRVALVNKFLTPIYAHESQVRLMAWVTGGRTGAEIELLVRTYKKSVSIRRLGNGDFVETLRQFTTLNSERVDTVRSKLLFDDSTNLWCALKNDPELNFSITDISNVTGRSKSTVSRHFRKLGVRQSKSESEVGADG